jgi:hypothetical protein
MRSLSAAVRVEDYFYNELDIFWRNESGDSIVGINLDVNQGEFFYNGSSVLDIQPDTWYDVTFAGLDWDEHTVNELRVDGDVIASDLAFLNPGDRVSNITMSTNAGGTGARSWFDNIKLLEEGSGYRFKQDTFEPLSKYGDVEAAQVTNGTAYEGKHSLVITDRNEEMFQQNGHGTGNRIYRDVHNFQPNKLSAAVRVDNHAYNDLRIYWQNKSNDRVVGINLDEIDGKFFYNGTSVMGIQSNKWYKITFSGINWDENTVEKLRVNGNDVVSNLTFLNPANKIYNISMSTNAANTGAQSWFDNITTGSSTSTQSVQDQQTANSGTFHRVKGKIKPSV